MRIRNRSTSKIILYYLFIYYLWASKRETFNRMFKAPGYNAYTSAQI